ncbi:hypothetical protein LTR15_011624 [Elasticomyces elasticus]|nr:hypothetical protein LTR15_011624 [Elasticomyces elasticus]
MAAPEVLPRRINTIEYNTVHTPGFIDPLAKYKIRGVTIFSCIFKTTPQNPNPPAYMGKGFDIIIFFSIISVIVLIMELINLLNKHMPPRRPLRGESAPLLRSSTPAHISRSWFWPRSEQTPQHNADLETGLSQGYGTFDEVHDEDPEAPQPIPQLVHVTKRAKPFNPAPSSFYSRPASLPSRRATSSPPQSMLLESPTTSQDENEEETSPPATEYQTLHTFGQSGEGQVRVVKEKSSAELFVIKTIRARTRKDGTIKMPNEVAMLTLYLEDHLNILQCYDYSYERTPDNTFCHMVLEYCSGGDLFDSCAHWRKLQYYQGKHAPEMFLMHFLISVAETLAYIHLERGIIHRDIKLSNFTIRPGTLRYGLPDIVLCDWGFSCFESESLGICGTPGVYPSEFLPLLKLRKNDPVAWENMKTWNAKYMSYGSDMYCLGATLYDLIFNDGFDNTRMTYSPTELAQRFSRGPYTQSPWILDILTRCLAEDPMDRMTTAELVHAAIEMKEALTIMGDAGVRMPANSWPKMQLDCDRVQAPPQSSKHTSAGASAGEEAPVVGSSESFPLCWCENHGAMSLRRPKLGCETSQSMTYRPRPGARTIVSEEAAGAGAGADDMTDADMDMGMQAGQMVACAA